MKSKSMLMRVCTHVRGSAHLLATLEALEAGLQGRGASFRGSAHIHNVPSRESTGYRYNFHILRNVTFLSPNSQRFLTPRSGNKELFCRDLLRAVSTLIL